MKALHFGAGNIGRGFIGLILNENGYSVTFADVNQDLINKLKKEGKYNVILADKNKEKVSVEGINAINSQLEEEKLKEAIVEADVITTAVGANIINIIAKTIVPGIKARLKMENIKPLNIIACENALNATDILKENLFSYLNKEEITKAEKYIGFPNSAVDRIVPIQDNKDSLDVVVEPFFEWVIEGNKLVGDIHRMDQVHYVEDLKPYIERKIFTLNTGHASTAYAGNIYGYKTILEAINDSKVMEIVQGVIKETSIYLINKHDFDKEIHKEYVDTIINRFMNPNISDEIKRVGRSPIRKISPKDRLVYPAVELLKMGITPEYLSRIISYALKFLDIDDSESIELRNYLEKNGVEETLIKYSGIDTDSPLIELVEKYYNEK